MDGIILIDKEKDWTSQDVCSKIKRILKCKKVGHTGTLDPFATGLLVVTIDQATKISQFIEPLNKSYVAILNLGEKKSSGDITGETIETSEIPPFDEEKIKEALNSLLGKQEQIPPMTSAIKVDGVPLYRLAHEGQEIARQSRPIEIFDIKLLSFDEKTITFAVDVSKGTYIRTLGETIAEKLGTCGYLSELRRTKVGKYLPQDAIKIGEVYENKIVPLNEALSFLPRYVTNKNEENMVSHGMKIYLNSKDPIIALYSNQNVLLAIYQKDEEGTYRSLRGFQHGSS